MALRGPIGREDLNGSLYPGYTSSRTGTWSTVPEGDNASELGGQPEQIPSKSYIE